MYLKNMQGSALMLVHCLEQVKYYNRQVKNKQVYIHLWAPVAKGEQGHPTRTRTQIYRVPNMLSDRHTKEPGSMAWQPESIFIRSDDHIVTLPSPSGSAPMRFTYTDIPHAYTNHASPIQSTCLCSESPHHPYTHTSNHSAFHTLTLTITTRSIHSHSVTVLKCKCLYLQSP